MVFLFNLLLNLPSLAYISVLIYVSPSVKLAGASKQVAI